MRESIIRFNDFQHKKRGSNFINETVIPFDDYYKVRVNIDVPFSLVNSYIKKIKDETGQDIKKFYSEIEIAEEIAKYVSTSYLNIENIPGDILAPENNNGLVVNSPQPQGQGQSQFSQFNQGQPQGQGGQPQGQGGQSQGQGGQSQGQGGQSQGQGGQSQGQGGQLDLNLDVQNGQTQHNQGQTPQHTANKISPNEI